MQWHHHGWSAVNAMSSITAMSGVPSHQEDHYHHYHGAPGHWEMFTNKTSITHCNNCNHQGLGRGWWPESSDECLTMSDHQPGRGLIGRQGLAGDLLKWPGHRCDPGELIQVTKQGFLIPCCGYCDETSSVMINSHLKLQNTMFHF